MTFTFTCHAIQTVCKMIHLSLVFISIKLQTSAELCIKTYAYHKVRHPRCVYNKLDWSVYTCLTQLHDGRDMYTGRFTTLGHNCRR